MEEERERLLRPDRMWGWLGKALIVAAALFLGFVGIVPRKTFTEPVWAILDQPLGLSVGSVAALIVVLLAAVWGAFNLVLQAAKGRDREMHKDEIARSTRTQRAEVEELAQQLHRVRLELDTSKGLLLDSERRRMTDVVTGIPNYSGWENDLEKWASRARDDDEFSMALIDLDNLGALNERSPRCADQVLRFFAQKTYGSMRRDEQVYKGPNKDGPIAAPLWSEMYRHYAGGDEFFFIFSGDVYDALGFLNRLADRLRAYSDEIRREILPSYLDAQAAARFELSFAGVATVIRPGDTPGTVLENLLNTLARAKKDEASRVLAIFDQGYQSPREQVGRLEAEIARQTRPAQQTDAVALARLGVLKRRLDVVRGAQQRFGVPPAALRQ